MPQFKAADPRPPAPRKYPAPSPHNQGDSQAQRAPEAHGTGPAATSAGHEDPAAQGGARQEPVESDDEVGPSSGGGGTAKQRICSDSGDCGEAAAQELASDSDEEDALPSRKKRNVGRTNARATFTQEEQLLEESKLENMDQEELLMTLVRLRQKHLRVSHQIFDCLKFNKCNMRWGLPRSGAAWPEEV